MQLRSGRISDKPVFVSGSIKQAVVVEKEIPVVQTYAGLDVVEYVIRRDAFCEKFKGLSKEHDLQLELPETNKFICEIVYFSNIFELVHDNFDIISLPEFSGKFKSIALEKIEYWHKEIPTKIFKHLLEDEVFDAENIRAAVVKTNTAVEAVAKQFESLNKA